MPEHLYAGDTIGPAPFDPATGFVHPAYAGTDPAYLAWLAGADLQSTDATTRAKRRRGEADTAYNQALADLSTDATSQRRNLQTNMISRGMFHSGEFDRRGGELDSAFDQAKLKAGGVYQSNLGAIDDEQRGAVSALATQGATQVSQAMLRDAVAAYNAQQAAVQPAPAAPAAAPVASQPAKPYAPPAAPANYTFNPVNSSASLYASQSMPKPKPASGSTGALTQKRKGLQ